MYSSDFFSTSIFIKYISSLFFLLSPYLLQLSLSLSLLHRSRLLQLSERLCHVSACSTAHASTSSWSSAPVGRLRLVVELRPAASRSHAAAAEGGRRRGDRGGRAATRCGSRRGRPRGAAAGESGQRAAAGDGPRSTSRERAVAR